MQNSIHKQYWDNYSDQMIRIDPFVTYKMGIVQAQTALKIDQYTLICAPFRISMKKAELFVVLSKEELPFFHHYTTKTASLKLAFQPVGVNFPLKFIVWVSINKLSAVQDKDNMVMIDISFKSYPEDLIELIGSFFTTRKILESYFPKLMNKQIPINKDTSRILKFNDFTECRIGNRTIEAKLVSIAVNKCILHLPGIEPNLAVGNEFITKFFFQRYRFAVKGKIGNLNKPDDGFLNVEFEYGYSPELTDIVSEYFIKKGMLRQSFVT
jgi:hypothetical protein